MSVQESDLPGRLGDPNKTVLTDERLDPRIKIMLEAAASIGEGVDVPAAGASYDECLAYCATVEANGELTHPMMLEAMPEFPNVVSRTETIQGVDGNDITLFIHEPKQQSDTPRPCVLHTHGGGMVLMAAADPMFIRWRNDVANKGIVVVGVEFRNGGGKLGNHAFPAGLNDCSSALDWVFEQRQALNISTITISGESGGGNLAIATTLKAKQDKKLNQVNGVYAMCPYISGAYANPPSNLVSLYENDGYTLSCEMMAAMVCVYDPNNEHSKNPLAWPYQADSEALQGLPPVTISVNELDPLRDEGLAFARKLLAAGNSVVAKTVNGTTHAADLGMPDVTPDIYAESLNSLCNFVNNL